MIVLGCGKAKLARSAPAGELYTGSLFRMARGYAQTSGQRWLVLSGAHGVLRPEVVIRPYDAGPPEDREGLKHWGMKAALEIGERRQEETTGAGVYGPVVLLMGKRYARPLIEAMDLVGLDWVMPLEGLGLGRRLQKLKAMTDDLHSRVTLRSGEGKETMKLDKETIGWLATEAKNEGDVTLARTCGRALEGDAVALLSVEETLRARVARAHQEHRSYGHS